MSLIPAFEIGVWNAWVFILYEVITIPFLFRIAKGRGPDPESPFNSMSKTKKAVFFFSKVVIFLAFGYSIFVPLKLGTIWFYVGLPITLIGLVIGTIVLVDWAKTPRNEPVTRGLYRYSRHPMYIGLFFLLLGVSISTASWVFLLVTVVVTVVSFAFANVEEQGCLERYGEAYREYMNRTPRLLGMPKS